MGNVQNLFADNSSSVLEAFSASPEYKVLLCHHPEYYPRLSQYPIDLILSGHCHGGQIRVFGRGIFAPGQGLLPKYHHGVYDGRLVVSAGCANIAPIPRWGNEPEVVIVSLSKEIKEQYYPPKSAGNYPDVKRANFFLS